MITISYAVTRLGDIENIWAYTDPKALQRDLRDFYLPEELLKVRRRELAKSEISATRKRAEDFQIWKTNKRCQAHAFMIGFH
jgi:hypothetical protein